MSGSVPEMAKDEGQWAVVRHQVMDEVEVPGAMILAGLISHHNLPFARQVKAGLAMVEFNSLHTKH